MVRSFEIASAVAGEEIHEMSSETLAVSCEPRGQERIDVGQTKPGCPQWCNRLSCNTTKRVCTLPPPRAARHRFRDVQNREGLTKPQCLIASAISRTEPNGPA